MSTIKNEKNIQDSFQEIDNMESQEMRITSLTKIIDLLTIKK